MHYIWDVEIPEGEQVVDMGTMLKCHKLILWNKQTIWDNNELCNKDVKQHGITIKYVKNQTVQLCLDAINTNGLALEFVNLDGSFFKMNYKQSPEICLAAVKQNGDALKFVKKPTEQMCITAIKQSFNAHNYISNRNFTPGVREQMMTDHGWYLKYLNN